MLIKKQHIILLFTLFCIVVFLVSCEEEFFWENKNTTPNLLVVEGIITNERKNQEIKLSRTINELNNQSMIVSGAKIFITDGRRNFNFTESSTQKGTYISDSSFIAVTNRLYGLVIVINNKVFTAQSGVMPVFEIPDLKYNFDETKNLYYITYVAPAVSSYENAMYEIFIDWSKLPAYANVDSSLCQKTLYYYTLNSVDINQLFAPEKERIYFPRGTLIRERKYSLTPKHAAFIRSLLLENEWSGGVFDSEHANLKTNLSLGATGFFGACSVRRKLIRVR